MNPLTIKHNINHNFFKIYTLFCVPKKGIQFEKVMCISLLPNCIHCVDQDPHFFILAEDVTNDLVCLFVALRPKSTTVVIAGRTTLFPGQA